MGFASKLEDETERRGGELPRSITHRMGYVFNAYGVTSTAELKPTLQFDDAAEAKVGEILKRLELAHQRRLAASASVEKDPTKKGGISKLLKTHKSFASDIDALVIFLVPYVRQMHGSERRDWNRKIEKLKDAQYL